MYLFIYVNLYHALILYMFMLMYDIDDQK